MRSFQHFLQEQKAIVTLSLHSCRSLSTTHWSVVNNISSVASVRQGKGLSWHFATFGKCGLIQTIRGFFIVPITRVSKRWNTASRVCLPIDLITKGQSYHPSSMWYCLEASFCQIGCSASSAGVGSNSGIWFQALIRTDGKWVVHKCFLQDDSCTVRSSLKFICLM